MLSGGGGGGGAMEQFENRVQIILGFACVFSCTYIINANKSKKLTDIDGGHGNYYTLVRGHRKVKVVNH